MIKLIVSDLDGTLLSSRKKPPRDLKEVLDRLKEKGIAFVAATGRDLNGGSAFFSGYAEGMYFICDNGASIYKGNKLLTRRLIPPALVKEVTGFVRGIDRADCILCCESTTYITRGHPAFERKMKNHYSPTTFVENFDSVSGGIFKISIFDSSGDIEHNLYLPLKERFGDSLTIHESRNIWVDVMDSSASKGAGVRYVRGLLGAEKADIMAFGDYYNDLPLFKEAAFPYVMENGRGELKKRFPLRAPSCDEAGVTKIIREKVLGEHVR